MHIAQIRRKPRDGIRDLRERKKEEGSGRDNEESREKG